MTAGIPADALASLRNGDPDSWEQPLPGPGSAAQPGALELGGDYGLAVAQVGQLIRDKVREHFTHAEVPLPERVVVLAGAPRQVAWDVEQATVTLVGIGWGAYPGQGATAPEGARDATMLRHAVFEVAVVRRAVTADSAEEAKRRPPRPGDLHQKGLEFLQDAGLLSSATLEACRAVDAMQGGGGVAQAGAVEPAGPEGGMVALMSSITVTMGY